MKRQLSTLAGLAGSLIARGLTRIVPVEDSLEDLAEDLSREAEARSRGVDAGAMIAV